MMRYYSKKGLIKGLINMNFTEELHVAYKIANEKINHFPYPHLFVKNVFTNSFYAEIIKHLPDSKKLTQISKTGRVSYDKERYVLLFNDTSLDNLNKDERLFWVSFKNKFLQGDFKKFLISLFADYIEARFENFAKMNFYDELMLINDRVNYSLGPHSDKPKKVISVLFYLPKDESQINLGTSIYFPKDRSFRCQGTAHHPYENFEKIITMPFFPNSLFCFIKTDNSFHGVEKIITDEKRWLLLYDIYTDVS
jgi:hypothetical protein